MYVNLFQDGPNRVQFVDWSGNIEILAFAFRIRGVLVGTNNIRFIETDTYTSGTITIPRAGVTTTEDLLPLIKQKYNAKLSTRLIE